MEKSMLIQLQDITAENVRPIIERAEEFRVRFPKEFEGWYLLGLCFYRMGRKSEALYYLTRAYDITPDPSLKSLIQKLGGDVRKASLYVAGYYLRQKKSMFITYLLFLTVLITMAWMTTQ